MDKITVWTRQSEKILQDIEQDSRYIVKREFIEEKMENHAGLYFDVYHWYAQKAQRIVPKPDDVLFPVWVSVTESSKLGVTEGNVFLELEVDRNDLIILNQEKWGYVVNYMYIPQDDEDEAKHEALLAKYQTHDTAAYLSGFYPVIKSKIIKSWERLFENDPVINDEMMGTLWEIRKEWIKNITTYSPV